jgi:hypothetical protein
LNSGLHVCKAGTVPVEPYIQSFFHFSFFFFFLNVLTPQGEWQSLTKGVPVVTAWAAWALVMGLGVGSLI